MLLVFQTDTLYSCLLSLVSLSLVSFCLVSFSLTHSYRRIYICFIATENSSVFNLHCTELVQHNHIHSIRWPFTHPFTCNTFTFNWPFIHATGTCSTCVLILCLCACVCVCVCVCVHACVCVCLCVHECVRERERGRRTLWNRIEYVTRSHEMSLNLKFGNWRYVHVSNLQVLLVILIFTAVARKRSRSFCQKCRWLVRANMHTPYVCDFAWSDMVHGCMVYTECTKMAAVSYGTSHTSAVSTPLRWIFKNAL